MNSNEGSEEVTAAIPASAEPLSWFCAILLSLPAVVVIACTVQSLRPLSILLKFLSAVIPAYLILLLVMYRLPDPAVSKNFLVKQFYLSAVPLFIVVLIIELLIVLLAAGLIFSTELLEVKDLDPKKTDAWKEALLKIFRSIPLWKLFLLQFIVAYVVAAFCEEVGKYSLALRWKKTGYDGIRLGGILAVCTTAGLGLATTEQLLGALQMPVLMCYFRATIAFPLHCGTTFYVGIRIAENYLQQLPNAGFFRILAFPILVHGTFDFVGLAGMDSKSVPVLTYAIPIVQIGIASALWLVIFRRYKQFKQREVEKDIAVFV